MVRLFVGQSLKFRAERGECHDLSLPLAAHLRARRGRAPGARQQAGIVCPSPGRRLRRPPDDIDLPDLAGEVTAAIERYASLWCRTRSVHLVRACAPIPVWPANPLALLENIRKNINARWRKTNVPVGRGAIPIAGSLNLSRKHVIPAVAKGSARERK